MSYLGNIIYARGLNKCPGFPAALSAVRSPQMLLSNIGSTKLGPIGCFAKLMATNSAACGGGHEQRGNPGGARSAYDC